MFKLEIGYTLPLPLTHSSSPWQIFQFFLLADRDNDYRIIWSEVEQDVPRILSKIYEDIPAGAHDWCLMTKRQRIGEGGKEEEETWYFNKRTSEVRKSCPMALDKEDKWRTKGGKEEVLENTKTLDMTLTWLDWEFKRADLDRNGTLSRNEFMAFIRGLRIGLNEKEVKKLWRGGRATRGVGKP